jgi:indolepyruvate ferredoxin oxidoreductase, beta subunit
VRAGVPEEGDQSKRKKMKCDVIIVGVGGQGILVTSNVISQAALDSGYDVKKSETHGMAQRGGSVVTHVRIGDRVDGVLIPKGEADILIASEPVEGLRYMDYLKKDGKAIVNSEPIQVPGYPIMEAVRDELTKQGAIIIDAMDLALKAGHPLTQSIVLVGASSQYLPMKEETIKEAIKKVVSKKIDENLKAFDLGRGV